MFLSGAWLLYFHLLYLSPTSSCRIDYIYFILQLKRVMESDAAMTEDLIAYNIIPLDAPNITNSIVSLPEVIGLLLTWFKLTSYG